MNSVISFFERNFLFDRRLAFARSLFALSTLSLLIFNDISIIGNKKIFLDSTVFVKTSFFYDYTIFSIFGNTLGTIISIIILCACIIGYFPKITIILQAYIQISITTYVLVIEGGDQITSICLFLLIPIVLLDNRKNHWNIGIIKKPNIQKYKNITANFFYFLIRLQIAVLYLDASIGKLSREDWLDGTCMYYWTTNNIFGVPVSIESLVSKITLSPLSPIIAWGTIIFELSLFANLFATSKNVRKIFLVLGILFHFIIALTFGLFTFFLAMVGCLILYLDFENSIFIKLLSLIKKIRFKSNLYHLSHIK